jgi:lysophospholipase L1-like esterase
MAAVSVDTPTSSAPVVALASAPVSASAPSTPPSVRATPPKKGTVVLHVGDSFVHSGLTQKLRTHFDTLGVRYEVRAEQSTNSLDWAKRVPGEVAASQPDLVIVTLGGNEIGSKHLDVQARAIKKIVASIGDRPCVWTTPPLWTEESGLFDTLQKNVAPCRFFETDRVIGSFIPRRKDKIHPTMEGGAVWADKLFAWLMDERTGDVDKPWLLKAPTAEETTPRGIRGPLPKP